MKYPFRIFIVGFIFQAGFCEAQNNLVPNWSFEDTLNCPSSNAQVYNSPPPPWFQSTTQGTPDYFNSCTNAAIVDVPKNLWGYQNARTGEGYMGMGVYAQNFVAREYISVKLNDSLVAKEKYCIEFYVSLSDSSTYAISSMGIYLSQTQVLNSYSVIPFVPQVMNPSGNILVDKLGWMQIFGEYVAVGGETYITIGNFNLDAASNATYLGGNSSYSFAYYYIDDVSVYLCDSMPPVLNSDTIFIPNIFTPNGDGQNDVLTIGGDGLEGLSCSIFNRWGEQVAALNLPKQGWDGSVNGMECSAGVYFYVLTGKDKEGREVVKKGSVTLYR